MAREYAIPSSSTILQDFGLAVSNPPTSRNRRVVIMGTAEDGPLYEPVIVDLPSDSEYVWGRQTKGDLVRGIFECWNSQEDNQNVVGVRIGTAKTSVLEIGELNSEGIDEEDSDSNITSLKLTGRFPGPIYDQITIQYDTGKNHAGDISLYNPKTGLYSYFTVDRLNPYNSSVNCHNIAELVTAINNDKNMHSVVTASYDELKTDFELSINGATPGVVQTSSSVRLNLQEIISTSGTIVQGDEAYIVTNPDLPYSVDTINSNSVMKNLTVANNLVKLTNVESLGISNWSNQTYSGVVTKLASLPLDGKGTSKWDTIVAMKDYDGDDKYTTNPAGNVVSEYLYSVNFALANENPTDYKGYDETNTFNLNVDLPLDDTESPYISATAGTVFEFLDTTTYAAYKDGNDKSGYNYANATCLGIDTKKVNGVAVRPSGAIRIFASTSVDANSAWTELPYDPTSGVYMSSFTAATDTTAAKCTFSIGAKASGCYDLTISGVAEREFDSGVGSEPVKWTNMTDIIDASGFIKDKTYIRITGNTVKGFINEVETLSQLEAIKTKTPTSYFVRGQELLLNASAPYPMIFNYGTRVKYEIDSNVTLSDAFKGQITFTDPNNLPGPGGSVLSETVKSNIRLNYEYMPNFPAITSKAKTLFGGTTGANITTLERETEFRKVYEYLRNFEGDIWVPMGAYIDAIKEDYSETTGLLENQTNSFASDIEDFLDEQSINLYQPHAVLGVTQVSGDTIGDRDKWVTNLTVTNVDDPTRGANAMQSIQNKFISVAAFEPIFLNTGRGQPYASNGQAAYAGLIAALPYDVSPMNKTIPGIYSTRFPFSIGQLEALNGNRFVSMKTSDTRPPVIVNDITAAPNGSDYVNWSIFSITKEAADRIKRLADSYIGRPNSIEIRNALDQDISNVLSNMTGVQAFNFSIKSTLEQQILGVIEIDLVIVPVFTIKKIRTTIKLRKNVALG